MSQSSEKGGTPVGNVPHTFDRRGAWVASPLDSLTLICVGGNPICSLVFDADGNPYGTTQQGGRMLQRSGVRGFTPARTTRCSLRTGAEYLEGIPNRSFDPGAAAA